MKLLQFMLCDNILTSKYCWISVRAWRKHKQMSKQFRSLRRDYTLSKYFTYHWTKNNIFFYPLLIKIKQVSYLLATDYFLRKMQAVEISVF